MADVKITDLVDQQAIEKIKELNTEMVALVTTYTNTAKELAKGLEVNVKIVGDLDLLDKLYVTKAKEAAAALEKLKNVIAQQGQVIANTTPTVSRHLMEQERVNKAQRDAYTEHDKVKKLLEQFHDTYQDQLNSLAKINNELSANKKAQKENENALKNGQKSMADFKATQVELIAEHRRLSQEKRSLNQIMTAEEKAMQAPETSYKRMSQELELLKNAYKGLAEEGRNSPFGKELEAAIQNLDAHLKDVSADMGEFQRNVGNYAIAGQNGVVATESLVAVMNQQAVTMQDVADQTRILEEGKRLLNTEDANYQQTLDAVNAKLEENKTKLSDVTDILGREARSVSEAEAQNKRLSEAIKHIDLTSADAKKKLEEMRNQIERNKRTIADATGANEKFADSMLGLIGVNANLGSSLRTLGSGGNFIDGLHSKVKAFGQTLMGLLANPWVIGFLGLAAVGAAFKWWWDFNSGMEEASRLTDNFAKDSMKAANKTEEEMSQMSDKITSHMSAIADTLGNGYDETIGAANTMVQQFGVSWEEAMELMQQGYTAGANMSGNMLANIDRFGPALRDAGVSADEFMAILSNTRNGIFNEDGLQNILKAGTRLRAMTKQTSKALDDVGLSSQKMQKDLEDGTINMMEAVQQVAAKLKELPENSQEAGQIMKNVFGRTAAEGGMLLIESIADVNTNLQECIDSMDELGRVNNEQMNAQIELNEALNSVFKMSGDSFEIMKTKALTFATKALTNIIRCCADIVNWFIRMYNKSIVVRAVIQSYGNAFKNVWEVVKLVVTQILDSLKSVGTMIEGAVTLDWEKVKNGYLDGLKSLKTNLTNAGKTLGQNFSEAFNKTVEDKLQEVSIGYDNVDLNGIGASNNGNHDGTGTLPGNKGDKENEKANAKAAKDAEKRANEELKLLMELEEAKVALMVEGHEKDLALIRLNFKKKIDSIKGNSQTEIDLRLNYAMQCEYAVAECERKYREELSKINFENQLASVKKGSKEELTLRLAQIEKNRQAELKAAEKSGADVNLINEKFNLQRQEKLEEYAANRADILTKQYAKEQSDRDNAMMTELNALKTQYNEKLKAAKGNAAKMEEAEKELQRNSARIEEKYAQTSAKASIELLEKMLKEENLSAEDREKIEQDLTKAKMDMETLMADHAINETKRVTETEQEESEKRKASIKQWLQVAADSFNAVAELADALYESKIQKIEEEQERNDEAAEKEQARISDLVSKQVITEEEGEARKRAAEALTAKKNEELERKKAALKRKQAIWDKSNSVIQATIATSVAIVEALPNLVMAAIVGALGAAEIATILATPIPQYKKGTDYHKGGMAIVGDGGRQEVVLLNGKAWLTPDTPTLVDMPVGSSVIPSVAEFNDAFGGFPELIPSERPVINVKPYDDARLRRSVEELIYISKMMYRQQHRDAKERSFEIYKSKI